MIADHFPYAVFALLIEIGIVHAIYSKAPGMIFFPYHNAPFIAHVKKQLIIGIMAGAQRIRSHVPVSYTHLDVYKRQLLAAAFKIPVSFGLSVFLLAVMGADWCLQAFRIRESTNPRRFITGICGGFG